MAKKLVETRALWKSTYQRALLTDEELLGYGNPPGCPRFQAENPGQGQMPCRRVMGSVYDDGSMEEIT